MSLFSDVKLLFRSPARPVLSAAESQELRWDATAGKVTQPHQERTLSYHNNEVSGHCSGKIQELTGSTLISAFEDLPGGLKSLMIRLSVGATSGSLTVTLRRVDGVFMTLTAPGTLEEDVELENGHLRFKLQAGQTCVQGIHYQALII